MQYLDKQGKWLTDCELNALTKGCSSQFNINAQTVQAVGNMFISRRRQCKKRKLSWRSKSRSLGWIPFSGQSIKVENDLIIYKKVGFRFWKSREIDGTIKSGAFTQNSRDCWYASFTCEVSGISNIKSGNEVGIDLGLKTIATLSNGGTLNRNNITNAYATKLATAQRAKKKKQVTNIHTKIKNVRRDWNHKQTTKLINSFDRIIVGNVSSSKLKKTRMAKSVSDAGWADFKSMLAYKAIALGVEFKEVKENFSTVTCSTCFERTGPRGLSALGVREWICKCGASHNRDVNAAINILRFGHESPIKGSSMKGAKVDKL